VRWGAINYPLPQYVASNGCTDLYVQHTASHTKIAFYDFWMLLVWMRHQIKLNNTVPLDISR